MSGGEAHVENSIWMRAVLIGGVFLAIGILAFATMGVGVANVKHVAYEDAIHDYEDAKYAYEDAKASNASDAEIATLKEAKEEAHHHEVDAHLSYLTWKTAGITILLMCITYAAFIGLGGFLNSIAPSGDDAHDNHGYGGEDHEHHGSGSPIIFALGIMLFLMGFPSFQGVLGNMLSGTDFALGDLGVSMLGLVVVTAGVANWWREDLPFIGNGEQIATSAPFEGQHIRKAGLWVFIMSEVMVFATFFSSYLRMRTEWCTGWQEAAGNCEEVNMLTASDFLRPNGAMLDGLGGQGDFMTLLPGAINTFALIISSYTIVLALKTAKSKDWTAPSGFMGKIMPTQKAAVRNYLIATFLLGSMFIVLKLIEWSHLVAEGFTIGTQAGSIFYISTGAHGLHVFIGLLVMLYLIFKADTVGYDEKNGQGIEYFGLYWHFVDLAWVVIFPAFYLY
ncbi:MAG: heme-copper oxidase subunit III [Candidatus Poseidoniales archaeon]|nr:MAG: heme-copper oxidase subunit III [Candidatus Poseidoniales archaeon]